MYTRVYVEITNVCNKSCSFCPKNKRPPKMMSDEEFRIAAQKAASVSDYIYYHLMGEPLLHPHLCDFIKYSCSLGLKSAVTTNGTLLPEKGNALIESGVYKVNISLHSFEGGSDEEHEKYITGCIRFAQKASQRGVLTVLRLWNKGVANTKNKATERLIHEYLGDPEQVSARGMRFAPKLHLEYAERFSWPDSEKDDMGRDVFCHGLCDHFGVLVDGSIVPCCLDHEGEMTLGNIFTDDINSVLNGVRANTIRNGFKNKKAEEALCRRCGYARRFKI